MTASEMITVAKASEEFGYTKDAIYQKIRNKRWLQGKHYERAPDRRIFINRTAVLAWIIGQGQK